MANKLRGKTKKACESLTGAPMHLSISSAFFLLTPSAYRHFGCNFTLIIVSIQYTPRFRDQSGKPRTMRCGAPGLAL